MPEQQSTPSPTYWDQLVSRPAEPLPTVLDPSSPEARGAPADPKPDRTKKQGDAEAAEPAAGRIDRAV